MFCRHIKPIKVPNPLAHCGYLYARTQIVEIYTHAYDMIGVLKKCTFLPPSPPLAGSNDTL